MAELIALLRQKKRKLREKRVRVTFYKPYDPNWSDQELCANIIELSCGGNKLESLPNLPNVQVLYCDGNKLESLPPLPRIQVLYCGFNRLKSLPPLPNAHELYYVGNPLPEFTLSEWKKIWRLREKRFIRIYGIQLQRYFLKMKAQKKKKLHQELLYTPYLSHLFNNEYSKSKAHYLLLQ